jgi:MerR family transcriptional regulator, multidrug-efflux activator
MAYTVKAVAEMASVTIRTLHYYDHIGLLRPASVTPAGYRLYTQADLERLQQILFFRELGLALDEIRVIVDSPSFNRKQALASHRELLVDKQRRLAKLVELVDRTIESMERGKKMGERDMFEGFDQKQLEEWREEARQKWGSQQVDESWRRASTYTKEDWAAIQRESKEINEALAALMDRDPSDPEVQTVIERHFRQIDERFYKVTPEVYRGLGELYVSDARFTANYDRVKPGLAHFMKEAMRVYADRLAANG